MSADDMWQRFKRYGTAPLENTGRRRTTRRDETSDGAASGENTQDVHDTLQSRKEFAIHIRRNAFAAQGAYNRIAAGPAPVAKNVARGAGSGKRVT